MEQISQKILFARQNDEKVFLMQTTYQAASHASKISQQVLYRLQAGFARNDLYLTRTAHLDLHRARFHALRADGDAQRIADEVAVLELHTRAFRAIVEQSVDAGLFQLVIDILSIGELVLFLPVDWHNDDLERRDRTRPDNALLIVAAAIVRPTPMP